MVVAAQTRVGKFVAFGLPPTRLDEADSIMRTVSSDWRELVAGSEGFLLGPGRAGLENHAVVWGEMVSCALTEGGRSKMGFAGLVGVC